MPLPPATSGQYGGDAGSEPEDVPPAAGWGNRISVRRRGMEYLVKDDLPYIMMDDPNPFGPLDTLGQIFGRPASDARPHSPKADDRAGQGVDCAKEAIGSRAEYEGVGGGSNRVTVTHRLGTIDEKVYWVGWSFELV
jgi:hypothetical protein